MLIITTLPHYLAIPLTKNQDYKALIFLSTTSSIVYHLITKSNNIYIDYFLATALAGYEIQTSKRAFYMNILVFLIYMMIPYDETYVFYHNVWHLISASKTIYIASLPIIPFEERSLF
jgi:hypothetical protein